jgi:hypothetical protein
MQVYQYTLTRGDPDRIIAKGPNVGTMVEDVVKIKETYFWNENGFLKSCDYSDKLPKDKQNIPYAFLKTGDDQKHVDIVFNNRQERFDKDPYWVIEEKINKWSSLPTMSGTLLHTNDQATLTNSNQLVIQLYDKDHANGFFVDDTMALCNRWIATLRGNQFRQDAIACTTVALVALDNSAVKHHGYSDSPLEKSTPPKKDQLMPKLDEWIAIWNRAQETC